MEEIINWLNKVAVTPEDEKIAKKILTLVREHGTAKIYLSQIITAFENLQDLLARD